jgi:hypothetical protein
LLTHPLYVDSKFVLEHVVGIVRACAIEADNNAPVLLRLNISVKISAINLLKTWADNFWSDFSENVEMLTILQNLVDEFATQKLFQILSNVIKRRVYLFIKIFRLILIIIISIQKMLRRIRH